MKALLSLLVPLLLVPLDGWPEQNYPEGTPVAPPFGLFNDLSDSPTDPDERHSVSQPFLWGLGGFGITLLSGTLGIAAGGKGQQPRTMVENGVWGCFIGAGISLSTAAIFSLSTGNDATGPTFWGAIIGWLFVPIAGTIMNRDIPLDYFGLIVAIPIAAAILNFLDWPWTR